LPELAVYTAAFGDHDKPAELPGLAGIADLFCFTDSVDLKLDTWQIFRRPSVFRTPRMDAKWYKLSARHLMPRHSWSIYLDASIRVKDPIAMVIEIKRALDQSASDLALFSHPEGQRSLEEEAQFSMTFPKYAGERCVEQVAHYRDAGMPASDPDYRLYAGGVIGRFHSEAVERFEKRWLDECIHWSSQDQLSLPYVLWYEREQGVRDLGPGIIPGNIYDCPFLGRVWSGPNK